VCLYFDCLEEHLQLAPSTLYLKANYLRNVVKALIGHASCANWHPQLQATLNNLTTYEASSPVPLTNHSYSSRYNKTKKSEAGCSMKDLINAGKTNQKLLTLSK
jgi:hypothetical protein